MMRTEQGNYNFFTGLRTYGKRHKINLRTLGIILIILCLITPATNWVIPFLSKLKGTAYIRC